MYDLAYYIVPSGFVTYMFTLLLQIKNVCVRGMRELCECLDFASSLLVQNSTSNYLAFSVGKAAELEVQ